mgnify:CR=1 FL=1
MSRLTKPMPLHSIKSPRSPSKKPHARRPRRVDLYTPSEIVAFVHRHRAGDRHASAQLLRHHERFFRRICQPYVHRGLDVEDLMQEARRGFLFAASEKWMPDGGASVTTYCMYWADKFIQREVQISGSTIRVPCWAHDALTASRSSERKQNHTPHTLRQAADALRPRRDDLDRMARSNRALGAMGLIDRSAAQICDRIARQKVSEKVLAELPLVHRMVVLWRYVEDMKLSAIARRLKEDGIQDHLVSRQRIRAILSSATKRIRFWLECRGVRAKDVL